MSAIASQITSITIVYSTVCSGADQRKHQSSASLAFVTVLHRWPVNSPHKGPVIRKNFPFDDVILTTGAIYMISTMICEWWSWLQCHNKYVVLYCVPRANDPGELDQSNGCWCHGSLRLQAISGNVGYFGSVSSTEGISICLCVFHEGEFQLPVRPLWGGISTTCSISESKNDRKCNTSMA